VRIDRVKIGDRSIPYRVAAVDEIAKGHYSIAG
jgi:hypothetical protein